MFNNFWLQKSKALSTPLLLDESYMSGKVAFAFGLRKLKSTATASIRVRRSSDDAEQDIGFDGNDLDTTSLLSFIGANNGIVVKLYDQSGNGNHANHVVSGTKYQPAIVSSGTLQKINEKATMYSDSADGSTQHCFDLTTAYSTRYDFCMSMVFDNNTADTNTNSRTLVGGNSGSLQLRITPLTALRQAQAELFQSAEGLPSGNYAIGVYVAQTAISFLQTGYSTNNTTASLSTDIKSILNCAQDSGQQWNERFNGRFSEMIFSTVNNQADLEKIQLDQENYYSLGIGRGIIAGGRAGDGGRNIIDYITIATTGNATDFGDIASDNRFFFGSCASCTRGITLGGRVNDDAGQRSNIIEYINIAVTGNTTDFGDLSQGFAENAGCGNSTRGIIAGGGGPTDKIEYITIATLGNSTSFGTLTFARKYLFATANATRGIIAGGGDVGSASNVIEYVTIATTGNGTDFGDLLDGLLTASGAANKTRGIFSGGYAAIDVIQYITIATAGNATDFGNLTVGRRGTGSLASLTRCVCGGSVDSSDVGLNTIDYVTIASTGDATDFGDLAVGRGYVTDFSDCHGGLF